MAWITSHQELGRHPKTKRLARLLDCSLPCAVGHLQYLWWWALDFAQDGDLSRYEATELADAALWEGDPAAFVAALERAGFLEAGHTLHDWDQYAGRLVDQRQAHAARMRASRQRKTARDIPPATDNNSDMSRDTHVPITLPARADLQYSTVHNNIESDLSPAPAREAEPVDADWEAMARQGSVAASDDPAVAIGERGYSKRRAPLPPDFTLTPDRAAWARDHCPHVLAPQAATAKFVAHYRARPDKRSGPEWESAWQKWLLGDEERAVAYAAERGIKAPTTLNGAAENPHTRAYIEERRRVKAQVAQERAARQGVH